MEFLVRKQGVARKPLDPAAPARFLAEAAKAEESVHATPGLGSDHRLRFRWGHAAALQVGDTVVHLAWFGGTGLGQGHHPSEPPLRRRQHSPVEPSKICRRSLMNQFPPDGPLRAACIHHP
jgi:hypothetical protein